MDQVKIVNTPAELISAVNGEGARHIVIQSHMNIPETGDVRHAVLQLKLSTKSIQVCMSLKVFILLHACLLMQSRS